MWADLLSYYSEVYDSSSSKDKDRKKNLSSEESSKDQDKSEVQQPGL